MLKTPRGSGNCLIKETEDIANYQAQLAELEPLLASPAEFRKADGPDSVMPEWLANTLSSIAKHVQESSNIDRDAVAQSLLGLLVPAPPPIPPDALRSGTLDNTTDMCDVETRERARGQCRLATEHEQSAAHNEDDDGRDAATRGHQGSTAGNVVRLMIAIINVTSASSGGGATKAHVPDAGGLNITGRMPELDNLFSEADIDIIGVKESRLPQTQILQTRDHTVFNSGASPGKHHYGVQLWIRKRHAKAVKSTEAVNRRLRVAKIAMRAS